MTEKLNVLILKNLTRKNTCTKKEIESAQNFTINGYQEMNNHY